MAAAVDRKQLQMIIAGLTEGVIIIEPDQRITWANSSALSMHGVETPDQLGRTVAEYRKNFMLRYRNNHPLPEDQYPIERVLAGEAFTDVVVTVTPRHDPDLEWVHRIRSLVLTDSAEEPDCLVLVVADVTERFAAEERFERTFGANPAPAIICRLSDQSYIKVNQGFVDMTGYSRDDLLGQSARDIDLLVNAEHRALVKDHLADGRTIPQTEVELTLPAGGSKAVLMAGQPIEVRDEDCMLFTFADLEPRRKAELALRQSEERFAKAFQLSPVPTALMKREGFAFLAVNDAFVAEFGYPEAEVLGRPPVAIGLWATDKAWRRFEADLAETGRVRKLETGLSRRKDGELHCQVSAETVTINDEACVLSVFLDITERMRSERELMEAIEAVMADTSWFSQGVIEKLATLRRPGRLQPDARLESLTARERQILGLICQGVNDATISKRLSLSANTVRNHTAALYRKLGVHRRSDAVIWARERGFPHVQRPSA